MRERVFLGISAIELCMGILGICNITLPMSRFILWGFLLCYAALAFSGKHSRREKGILVVLLIFGMILYLCSGLNTGMKIPIYLYALKEVDKKKYAKRNLMVIVLTSLVIVLLAYGFGIGTWTVRDLRSSRGFQGIRYCFGFPNPNRTMAMVFIAMTWFLYLYGGKLKWYGFLGLGFICYIVYFFTDSRTSFLLGLGIIIMASLVVQIPWDGWTNILYIGFICAMAGMLGISILMACHVQNSWMELINGVISGRGDQLMTYPGSESFALPFVENWRLFGSKLNHNGYDLGYVQIFYYYGIIPACCYLLFILHAATVAWRRHETLPLSVLLGLSIYLFMETVYFSNFIPVNVLLTFAGCIVWGQYEEQEKTSLCRSFLHIYRRKSAAEL